MGFLFVAASGVIVLVAPPWPPSGATPDAILTYYAAHRMPFLVGNYFAALACIPGLVQVAGMAQIVRLAEGERGWLWIAVAATGTGAHATGAAAAALTLARAIDRTRVLPRWVAHAGWGISALMVCASLGTIWPVGALAAGGLATIVATATLFAWTFVTSIALLGRGSSASPMAARVAPGGG
jgi:hypothetical protein